MERARPCTSNDLTGRHSAAQILAEVLLVGNASGRQAGVNLSSQGDHRLLAGTRLRLRENARTVADVLGAPFVNLQVARLRGSPSREGRLIAEAMAARGGHLPHSLAVIERERQRLLASLEPLNDGSLGEGPVWDDISIAEASRASQTRASARLLYHLVRKFQPRTILELGTNLGISAAYLSAAQTGQEQRLVTLDASPYRLALARRLHAEAGLDRIEYVEGYFSRTLAAAAESLGQIDMAFIDGHHQHHSTLNYFETIAAHASDGCLFVFDDIGWSDGMRQAWAELRRYFGFSVVVTLHRLGLAVLGRKAVKSRPVRISFAPLI